MSYCNTHASPNSFEITQRALTSEFTIDASVTIALNIQYIVIPLDTQGNISDASIQAQHDLLNLHFLKYQGNQYMVDGIPHYPYSNVFGDPNIQFTKSDIVRLAVPASIPQNGFTSYDLVYNEYLSQGGKQPAGTILVFITTLQFYFFSSFDYMPVLIFR